MNISKSTLNYSILGAALLLAACITATTSPESAPLLPPTPSPLIPGDQPAATGTFTPVPLPTLEPMRVVQAHPADNYVGISWSPDGRLLASSGNDDEVIIWDATTLEPIYRFSHPGMFFSVFTSFSPDGRWLMVSEERLKDLADGGQQVDFYMNIWDLQTGTRLEVPPLLGVEEVVWSPDGNVLAYWAAASSEIRFWAVPESGTTAPQPFASLANEIGEMGWLADGTLVAAAPLEGGLGLWRFTDPPTLTTFAGPPVFDSQSIVLSLDGTLIAAPGDEGQITVWDTATSEVRYTLESEDFYGLADLAFSPNGTLLATALENDVRVWDLATGGVVATLGGQTSFVSNLAFSPDGQTLAAGEWSGEVRLWQLDAYLHPPVIPTPIPTSTPVPMLNVQPILVTTLTVPGVNPDEPGGLNSLRWLDGETLRLVTFPEMLDENTYQQRITDYDLVQGQERDSWLVEGAGGGFQSSYSPDGSKFAAWLRGDQSCEPNTVGVFDAATKTLIFQNSPGQLSCGNEIAWSPDGGRIAVQTFTAIEVFDVLAGAHVMTLENVIEDVYDGDSYVNVIWSPDGAWIASYLGYQSGLNVAVWDAATGAVAQQRYEPTSSENAYQYGSAYHIAFSPDSSTLLVVRSGRAELLDVMTGALEWLPSLDEPTYFLGTGTWSPDGVFVGLDYVEVKGYAIFVLVWNTQTGSYATLLPRASEAYDGQGGNLVWSPERPWLVTVDQGTIHILDAENQAVLQFQPASPMEVAMLVWSPDGTRLAIAGYDGSVEIWEFSE